MMSQLIIHGLKITFTITEWSVRELVLPSIELSYKLRSKRQQVFHVPTAQTVFIALSSILAMVLGLVLYIRTCISFSFTFNTIYVLIQKA